MIMYIRFLSYYDRKQKKSFETQHIWDYRGYLQNEMISLSVAVTLFLSRRVATIQVDTRYRASSMDP